MPFCKQQMPTVTCSFHSSTSSSELVASQHGPAGAAELWVRCLWCIILHCLLLLVDPAWRARASAKDSLDQMSTKLMRDVVRMFWRC